MRPRDYIIEVPRKLSIAEQFAVFNMVNPHVYDELLRMARSLRARGINRYSIAGLFEVLRFDHTMRTGSDDFKLNNNFRAFYARRLMRDNPEIAGLFELRSSAADGEVAR